MFKTRNGRNPVDPGNSLGLYDGGRTSNRGKRGYGAESELHDPRKEKLGRGIAHFSLALSITVHGVIFPLLFFCLWFSDSSNVVGNFPTIAGVMIAVAAPILILARILSNGLTSKEDHISYLAVKIYFIGLVVNLFILILMDHFTF